MNYGVQAPYQPKYPACAAPPQAVALTPWGSYGTVVGQDATGAPTALDKVKAQLQTRYAGIPLSAWLAGAGGIGLIAYLYNRGTFGGARARRRR